MDHRADGSTALSIDLLETVIGFVELVVGLDFPADTVEVGKLVRPDMSTNVREVEAV